MKKTLLTLVAFLILGIVNVYSQTFDITHSRIKEISKGITYSHDEIFENCRISYNQYSKNIEITSSSGINTNFGPFDLKSTSYEQDLYIETYYPLEVDLENINVFKFAYESKGGKPVMVIKISTSSGIEMKYYYTDYYFQLASKR